MSLRGSNGYITTTLVGEKQSSASVCSCDSVWKNPAWLWKHYVHFYLL